MHRIVLSLLVTTLVCLIAILSINISKDLQNEDKTNEGKIWKEREAIVKEEARIPSEEDIKHLEECYNEVISCILDASLSLDAMKEIYSDVQNAKVCSKANKYFNSLEAEYDRHKEEIDKIKACISTFEEAYDEYISMLESIPKYSKKIREEKYAEFEERITPIANEVLGEKEEYLSSETEVEDMYANARKIADDFFDEYYEVMCKIVNAEAGGSSDLDQYYVANVIENRVEHPAFKYYTVYDVVYAPGQYEPTWNGAINKIPNERVKKNMEDYLRGRVETGMPSEVTYQAKFPQGSKKDEPWAYIEESGHYYCYH